MKAVSLTNKRDSAWELTSRVKVPEEPAFSLAIASDLRLEFRATLRDKRFAEISSNYFTYAPMRAIVSGTAVNLAQKAASYFKRVDIIVKIGDDIFTPLIRDQVEQLGLGGVLAVEEGTPNGFAVVIRDAADRSSSNASAEGTRLIIASRPAPSLAFSPADMQAVNDTISASDAFFIDGYSLLGAESQAGVLAMVRTARASGTVVVVDLAPHDMDSRLRWTELLPFLSAADIIMSEAPTLARLLGVSPTVIDDNVKMLLPHLDEKVPGTPLWLVRSGEGMMQDVLGYQQGGIHFNYETGYVEASEKHGFGDIIASGEIYWWLSCKNRDPDRFIDGASDGVHGT